eukprot:gene14835-20888_t
MLAIFLVQLAAVVRPANLQGGWMFLSHHDADKSGLCAKGVADPSTACGGLFWLAMDEGLTLATIRNPSLSGILVFGINGGAGGDAYDSFNIWLALTSYPSEPVTYLTTEAQILAADFSTYKMIYMPSSESYAPDGVTADQSTWIMARNWDIESYINTHYGSVMKLAARGEDEPFGFLPGDIGLLCLLSFKTQAQNQDWFGLFPLIVGDVGGECIAGTEFGLNQDCRVQTLYGYNYSFTTALAGLALPRSQLSHGAGGQASHGAGGQNVPDLADLAGFGSGVGSGSCLLWLNQEHKRGKVLEAGFGSGTGSGSYLLWLNQEHKRGKVLEPEHLPRARLHDPPAATTEIPALHSVTSGIPALVPPALGEISTLQTIRLGGTPLMTGSLPRQWSNLNSLVSVELEHAHPAGVHIHRQQRQPDRIPTSALVKPCGAAVADAGRQCVDRWLGPLMEQLGVPDQLGPVMSYNLLTSTVPKEWGQEDRLENLLSLRLDGNELMCGIIPTKLENLKPNLTTLFMASVDRDLIGSTSQLPELLGATYQIASYMMSTSFSVSASSPATDCSQTIMAGVSYQIDSYSMSTSFSVPASSPVTDCSLDVMGSQLQEIAAILGIPLENITNECSMIDDSMRRALQQETTAACTPTANYNLNITVDPGKDQAEMERLIEEFIRTMRNPVCISPLQASATFSTRTVVCASYAPSLGTSAQVLCEEWISQAGATLSLEIATQASATFSTRTVVRASYTPSLGTSAQVLCEEWISQAGAMLSAEIATQVLCEEGTCQAGATLSAEIATQVLCEEGTCQAGATLSAEIATQVLCEEGTCQAGATLPAVIATQAKEDAHKMRTAAHHWAKDAHKTSTTGSHDNDSGSGGAFPAGPTGGPTTSNWNADKINWTSDQDRLPQADTASQQIFPPGHDTNILPDCERGTIHAEAITLNSSMQEVEAQEEAEGSKPIPSVGKIDYHLVATRSAPIVTDSTHRDVTDTGPEGSLPLIQRISTRAKVGDLSFFRRLPTEEESQDGLNGEATHRRTSALGVNNAFGGEPPKGAWTDGEDDVIGATAIKPVRSHGLEYSVLQSKPSSSQSYQGPGRSPRASPTLGPSRKDRARSRSVADYVVQADRLDDDTYLRGQHSRAALEGRGQGQGDRVDDTYLRLRATFEGRGQVQGDRLGEVELARLKGERVRIQLASAENAKKMEMAYGGTPPAKKTRSKARAGVSSRP